MIGGGRRGIGKTALTCALLGRFAVQHEITAVKVTAIDQVNRTHHPGPAETPAGAPGDACPTPYRITEEIDCGGDKDTARMLACGAARALWLQVPEAHLQEGIAALLERLGPQTISV